MSLRCRLAERPTYGCLGPRLSLDVVCARMLFEALLRHPIEGERRDGALQARGSHAPRATRATPAGEVFVFGPDHVTWPEERSGYKHGHGFSPARSRDVLKTEFLAISAGAWNRAG